jgi:hypothetical protein
MAVMAKVVAALRNGKHALLEAPTGTGKSLALLSAGTLPPSRDATQQLHDIKHSAVLVESTAGRSFSHGVKCACSLRLAGAS